MPKLSILAGLLTGWLLAIAVPFAGLCWLISTSTGAAFIPVLASSGASLLLSMRIRNALRPQAMTSWRPCTSAPLGTIISHVAETAPLALVAA